MTLCRFFIPRLNLFIQTQSHRKSISSREKCLIIDEQWRARWMRMTFQKSINYSSLQSSQSRRYCDDLYFPIAWWNSLSRSTRWYLTLTTLLVAPFTTNIASRDFQSCEIPQKKGGLIQVIPPHHESVSPHRITLLPYSIPLGKKIDVKVHSKVRSTQSEVHKCVLIW